MTPMDWRMGERILLCTREAKIESEALALVCGERQRLTRSNCIMHFLEASHACTV